MSQLKSVVENTALPVGIFIDETVVESRQDNNKIDLMFSLPYEVDAKVTQRH